jgi:tRNA-specific 2-thiouridylase
MRVAALVSGGVDSSVALALVKEVGYDVVAFYLKIWLEDETAFLGECPWEDDLRYVRKTCELLDVPLEIVPLQREYHSRVIAYALEEVAKGRTPNPDVMCNSMVKFGAFVDWLQTNNRVFDKIATGHYARVCANENSEKKEGDLSHNKSCTANSSLLVSPDKVKDQTYFLSRLTREQLSMAMFPLGEYTKTQVRKMAKERNLPSCDRPDSQGLCFLGKIDYADFVSHHLGEKEGEIINQENGEVVGKHCGHWLFTVGQRHGLHLSGGPWYVVAKDANRNTVFVSHRLKMKTVERNEFWVEDMRWIAPIPDEGEEVSVKIRHGADQYRCELSLNRGEVDRFRVRLIDARERGIAPGQFAVFYVDGRCLGSGVIAA